MYDPPNMMFQTPALESRFASLVRCDAEVGGYLIVNYDLPGIHWRTLRKHAAGLRQLRFVQDWIIIPNAHKEPTSHYIPPFSWDAGRQIAEATCSSRYGWRSYTIPFHSHPPGSRNGLSAGDVRVALAYERIHQHSAFAETAVASSYPFRLISYMVDGRKNKPATRSGEFCSWREKRFEPLRELMEITA